MDPFSNWNHGPEWFKWEFPTLVHEHETEVFEIWEAFLTLILLSLRLGKTKDTMGRVGYQPNLVSRKFGFSQSLAISYFRRKIELCLSTIEMNEARYNECLNRKTTTCLDLTPFPFETSFYCTQEFDYRWTTYYAEKFVVVSSMMTSLTYVFSSL